MYLSPYFADERISIHETPLSPNTRKELRKVRRALHTVSKTDPDLRDSARREKIAAITGLTLRRVGKLMHMWRLWERRQVKAYAIIASLPAALNNEQIAAPTGIPQKRVAKIRADSRRIKRRATVRAAMA